MLLLTEILDIASEVPWDDTVLDEEALVGRKLFKTLELPDAAFAESIRQFCVCGGGAGAARQYNFSTLRGHSFCGTIFDSTSSILPGLISKGIGNWTDPSTYPGVEYVRWNVGSYVYTDRCTDVTQREVFYGVTTFRGFDAFQLLTVGAGVDLPETFVDQGNSIRFPGNTTIANVPYVSDYIINFNF